MLEGTSVDLLVIGGGITGAGVARDAALRGLSVALVEREDFASGTSSRSSRLVHGGIRYLEHGHLSLVFESSRERHTLLQIAPHLVRPMQFLWPTYDGARVKPWKLRAGFFLYDALALFRNVARHELLTANDVVAREPMIRQLGLSGGITYYDAAADDARLTLVNALDAASAGAIVLNHAAVRKIDPDAIKIEDMLTGRLMNARARVVVNATGAWSDHVRQLAGDGRPAGIRPTKGSHILVPRERIRNDGALTITSPVDGRVMFVLPSGEHTIISTTESPYDGLPENVRATTEDITYLLRSANAFFPAAHLTHADVISAWAGVRPLAASDEANPGRASREHTLSWSTPWMLTVTGGKLTTYRAMADEIVQKVFKKLQRRVPKSLTESRALPGGDASSGAPGGIIPDQEVGAHLVRAYGSQWRDVWGRTKERPSLANRIVPDLPYIRAELQHAVESEMAMTLADVLVRRLHIAFETRDHCLSMAHKVATSIAPLLGWDAGRQQHEVERYRDDVARMFGVEA
ncbi:MAG TPA: glycerol-3-phosphate dehydrogenase [Gemmatimonadaceae bacterium]|nr:glycerol-3-phosphate dehydrogenase [Gemmatimonadaceae bacterium]